MRTDAQRAHHAAYMRTWRARQRHVRELDLGDPTWWQVSIVGGLVLFTLLVLAWTAGIRP